MPPTEQRDQQEQSIGNKEKNREERRLLLFGERGLMYVLLGCSINVSQVTHGEIHQGRMFSKPNYITKLFIVLKLLTTTNTLKF